MRSIRGSFVRAPVALTTGSGFGAVGSVAPEAPNLLATPQKFGWFTILRPYSVPLPFGTLWRAGAIELVP